MLPTPVVLIAFNRPDVTRRTLAAIRAARPGRLFLVCDGPRADRPDDAARCAEVRAVFDGVDWPCEVERRFSDVNLGCEGNVELGLDWVFAQVDRGDRARGRLHPRPHLLPVRRRAARPLSRRRPGLADRGQPPRRPARLFRWRRATPSAAGPACGAGRPGRTAGSGTAPTSPVTTSAARATDRGDAPVRTVPPSPLPGTLVTRAAQPALRRGGRLDRRRDPRLGQAVVVHDADRTAGSRSRPRSTWSPTTGSAPTPPTASLRAAEDDAAEAMPEPLRHPDRVALDVEVERELELLLTRVGGPCRPDRPAGWSRSPTMRRVAAGAVHSAPATYVAAQGLSTHAGKGTSCQERSRRPRRLRRARRTSRSC